MCKYTAAALLLCALILFSVCSPSPGDLPDRNTAATEATGQESSPETQPATESSSDASEDPESTSSLPASSTTVSTETIIKSTKSVAPGSSAAAHTTAPASNTSPAITEKAAGSTAANNFPVTVKIVGLDGEPLLRDLVIDASDCKTVGDALAVACSQSEIEVKSSGFGSFYYIVSIGGLSERQNGPGSGWVFFYNGTYSTKSAGSVDIEKGDRISFYYTLDMGGDVQNLENP